jgi:hypothetical protein
MKRKTTGYYFDGQGARYLFAVETNLDIHYTRSLFEQSFEGDVYDVREQGENIVYVTYETRNEMIHNLAEECNRNGSAIIRGYRVRLLSSEPF